LSPLLFAIWLLKRLKHSTLVARPILIAFAAVFFTTLMMYCYLLLYNLCGQYTCENYLNDVDMCINANKSQCIRFGRRYNTHCAALTTASGGAINWVHCCRYLGVFFTTGCTFKCNFDNAKSCFFRAFDALYSKVGRLASDEVVLSLIRAKCLPVPVLLGYMRLHEACPLLSRNRSSFEFTVTRLFMKLFRTTSPAVVKCCQLAFNFLPVHTHNLTFVLQTFYKSSLHLRTVYVISLR